MFGFLRRIVQASWYVGRGAQAYERFLLFGFGILQPCILVSGLLTGVLTSRISLLKGALYTYVLLNAIEGPESNETVTT